MKKRWQQLLCAFIMGLVLPGLATDLAAGLLQGGVRPEVQNVTTAPTEQEDGKTVCLPVLFGDGVVRETELESYLLGVVLAEMPASFEPEALKAQAVVARTYALKQVEGGFRHPQGAVCTDSGCCQAYIAPNDYLAGWGNQTDVDKVRSAVEATAGMVLTYGGALIEATYFSCSGGRTEDAVAVWGTDYPYLQAVDSPGEESAAPYRKTVFFTAREFAERLGRNLTGSPEDWLGSIRYTDGGGVANMMVAGKSYTGVTLRKLLGLNSTAFSMQAENGGITVTTRGKGHRVGMSQYGADAMAAGGSDYQQILTYYYQGTAIDKMDALG